MTTAKTKLNEFLITVNFVPNCCFSSGKETKPTMVRVVKKATAGTMLMPMSTKEKLRRPVSM